MFWAIHNEVMNFSKDYDLLKKAAPQKEAKILKFATKRRKIKFFCELYI